MLSGNYRCQPTDARHAALHQKPLKVHTPTPLISRARPSYRQVADAAEKREVGWVYLDVR